MRNLQRFLPKFAQTSSQNQQNEPRQRNYMMMRLIMRWHLPKKFERYVSGRLCSCLHLNYFILKADLPTRKAPPLRLSPVRPSLLRGKAGFAYGFLPRVSGDLADEVHARGNSDADGEAAQDDEVMGSREDDDEVGPHGRNPSTLPCILRFPRLYICCSTPHR